MDAFVAYRDDIDTRPAGATAGEPHAAPDDRHADISTPGPPGQQRENVNQRGVAWLVVIAKPAAEHIAARRVAEAGYRTYLPVYRQVIRGTRYDDRGQKTRPRGEIVMRPLFPGYLFAELHPSQGWAPIKQASGVAGLICVSERPALLSPKLIEEIREAERTGRFDDPRLTSAGKRRADIDVGDPVRIVDGPLAGFVGSLERLGEDGRAQALLSILGRETRIAMDQYALEPVSRRGP